MAAAPPRWAHPRNRPASWRSARRISCSISCLEHEGRGVSYQVTLSDPPCRTDASLPCEVEAYLRHHQWLPPEDQDLLARAAHGLLAGAVDPPVPGTGDLLGLGVIPGAAPHHGTSLRRVSN
jgi:hypothetical protein